MGIRRTLQRLVRGLTASEALELVAVFFPVSWFFKIMADIRKVLFLFKGLHLLEMKVKDFSDLLVESSRVRVNC